MSVRRADGRLPDREACELVGPPGDRHEVGCSMPGPHSRESVQRIGERGRSVTFEGLVWSAGTMCTIDAAELTSMGFRPCG